MPHLVTFLLPLLLLLLLPNSSSSFNCNSPRKIECKESRTKGEYTCKCTGKTPPRRCFWDSECQGIWAYGKCDFGKCKKKCTFSSDCPSSHNTCRFGKCCTFFGRNNCI
eukprot:TRINITY_DN6716_c0_g1_i2.p1 TRINITY_DN6716_c0_g1~~TRINITY_DN6716_c0_g1_i2.p1  ORF type:complete len:109 (-),score=22.37 TRINITY_DN6716_c0_g1_i2:42-368(-)